MSKAAAYTWTGTEGLLMLERDSRERNRGPNQKLIDALDPQGIHVMSWKFPHNDAEWRAKWLVKLKGQKDPVEIWMDNGFEAFAQYTTDRHPFGDDEAPSEQEVSSE